MSCANNEIEETTTKNDITETKINENIDMEILDELGEYNFENRIFNIIYSEDQMGSSWSYCSDELNGEILNDAVYNRELSVEERFNVIITWQNTGGTFTEGHCQPDCVNVRIKFTNPSHAPKANQAYRE